MFVERLSSSPYWRRQPGLHRRLECLEPGVGLLHGGAEGEVAQHDPAEHQQQDQRHPIAITCECGCGAAAAGSGRNGGGSRARLSGGPTGGSGGAPRRAGQDHGPAARRGLLVRQRRLDLRPGAAPPEIQHRLVLPRLDRPAPAIHAVRPVRHRRNVPMLAVSRRPERVPLRRADTIGVDVGGTKILAACVRRGRPVVARRQVQTEQRLRARILHRSPALVPSWARDDELTASAWASPAPSTSAAASSCRRPTCPWPRARPGRAERETGPPCGSTTTPTAPRSRSTITARRRAPALRDPHARDRRGRRRGHRRPPVPRRDRRPARSSATS